MEGTSYRHTVPVKAIQVIKQIDTAQFNQQETHEMSLQAKRGEKLQYHPNVLNCKEVYKTKKEKICLVVEFVGEGSLSLGTLIADYKLNEV